MPKNTIPKSTRNLLRITISCIVCVACSDSVVPALDGKQFMMTEGLDGAKHHDGQWYIFDNFAGLVSAGGYQDDRRIGIWEIFHSNGKVRARGKYHTLDRETEFFGGLDTHGFDSPVPIDSSLQGEKGDTTFEKGDEAFDDFQLEDPAETFRLTNGETLCLDGLWEYYDPGGRKEKEVMYEMGAVIWEKKW